MGFRPTISLVSSNIGYLLRFRTRVETVHPVALLSFERLILCPAHQQPISPRGPPGLELAKVFNEVLGVEVEVPEEPTRIVSFSPAATEVLFQIGLGADVVGVSAFCARPPEAREKRKVGSYDTVREEVLDELKPDLIITVTGYQRDFAVRLSKKYPVYPLELPVTVAGILDFVVKVGLVGGAPDSARELSAELLREVGKLRPTSGLKGYVEIDLGGPVTFGSYSYITDAFRMLGCKHMYDSEKVEWIKPDLSSVDGWDPDIVVYEPKMYSKFSGEDLIGLIEKRKWEGLRAVNSGSFYSTPGPLDFLAHHGPSFVTVAMPWLEEKFRMTAESR